MAVSRSPLTELLSPATGGTDTRAVGQQAGEIVTERATLNWFKDRSPEYSSPGWTAAEAMQTRSGNKSRGNEFRKKQLYIGREEGQLGSG